MLITLPIAWKIVGVRGLVPDPFWMHTMRGIFLCSATFFFFWALKFLPIADTLAIFFVGRPTDSGNCQMAKGSSGP
jgi:hypothetical protein